MAYARHVTLAPDDATTGRTIQLALEATDNGTPALRGYQRVVVFVRC